MKRAMIAGLAALSTLIAAPAAFADPPPHARAHGRGHAECRGHECGRRGNPGHGWNDERHGGRHLDRHRDASVPHITINIGDDGRYGERWTWRDGYGFGPAPRGREYRVINGQLVMVDAQTLQIVAIVGLLSALLN
ncbi:hypothetical protein [Pararhodobacter aggregans]|nr:hypothetical protein [Pararhodobacter aggregans]PTX02710.1 hypothetical protein C8N33_10470 [Pararhodobacter aggregans]